MPLRSCAACPPLFSPFRTLQDAHSLLRPEAVESFFLLWKVTGDPRFKEWAWQVFRALDKWARVRPSDRAQLCAACQAQAAYAAAEAASASAHAHVAPGRVQLQQEAAGLEACSSCSSSGGYSSLVSVLEVPPRREDKVGWLGLCGLIVRLQCAAVEARAACPPAD